MKILKTLAAVFFAAAVITLTGCSKDPEELIVGSWQMESMTITESGHTDTETPPAGYSEIYTFKEDHVFELSQSSPEESWLHTGTYSVSGDQLTIEEQMVWGDEEGPHEYSSTEIFTIQSLDRKAMTLMYEESASNTVEINLKKI